jgi:PKD repeat protein
MMPSNFFTKSKTISLLIAFIIMTIALTGVVSADSPTTNAIYISDTIPPTMNAGQTYTVTIMMKNTGTMTWNSSSVIRLGGVGDNTGEAAKFGPARIDIPQGVNVAPGGRYPFTFTMTAPPTAGYYTPKYRMVWEGHQWFGSQAPHAIQVIGKASVTPVTPVIPVIPVTPTPTPGKTSAPVAQFSASTIQGTAPLTIQFTDKSVSTGTTSYKWDVNNDGKTDYTTKNPLYTYKTAGTYSVKLIVTNAYGSDSEIKTNYIRVISSSAPVTANSITVTSPNGGETWQRGSTHTVTWDYSGSPGSTVKIVLVKGTTEVGTISASTSTGSNGKGSYTWPMSTDGSLGSNFRVSVQSISQPTIKDSGSSYFTIVDGTGPTQTPVVVQPTVVKTGTGNYGAESNPTGDPIGGGAGYSKIISGTETVVKYTVSTKAELLTALKGAKSGETVFVKGTSAIDLTGTPSVTIPAGVTLASNRGLAGSSGALIKRTKNLNGGWEEPMFIAGGDNVRVTGLRLEGEMYPQDYGNNAVYPGSINERYYLVGLYANGVKNLVVDNNELRGWAWASVSLRQTSGTFIHHNYIHHNQARGEGYGVCLYSGNALIEANLFDYNRHDVTGAGMSGEQYEARYNRHLGHGNAIGATNYDVHQDEETGTGLAGNLYKIHHNTIDGGVIAALQVRGMPKTGMYVDHNIINSVASFTGVTGNRPIFQTSAGTGNMFVTQNYWKGTLYPTDSGIVVYY